MTGFYILSVLVILSVIFYAFFQTFCMKRLRSKLTELHETHMQEARIEYTIFLNEIQMAVKKNVRNQVQLTELQDKINYLQGRIDDYEDSYKHVMDERCPDDRIHCSCVPDLKRMIKEKDERIALLEKLLGGKK